MRNWDIPLYAPSFAARLTGLSPGRIRRWLQGYSYTEKSLDNARFHVGPVIKRETESRYASFLDLIDLLFVKQFLDHGITLQKLRKALSEAETYLDGHHFAQRKFFTDGKSIFLELGQSPDDRILQLLAGGQLVFTEFVEKLAHKIEFDESTGFAQKWYPLGKNGLIVIDPKISFGRPVLTSRNINTENIYDVYLGEGKIIGNVCDWMELKKEEVEAAVKFENLLAAA